MVVRRGRRAIRPMPLTSTGNYGRGPRRTADVRRDRHWDAGDMSDQPSPVLVGIDGTASGLEAVDLGAALAVLTDAPVVLGAVYAFEGEMWPTREMAERALAEAQQRLP